MIKNVAKKIWRHESGNQTKYMELSTHSYAQERKYLVVLSGIAILLVSIYPFLTGSTYQGSADFHESIEMVGALFGLVTGFALITHFYSLGNRLHLLIGLAFFVNGAEDLVHGLLSFGSTRWFGGPESSLAQFIPGTYVTGRILLGLLLITALFIPMGSTESRNLKKETILASLTVIFLSISATVLAFKIPLPDFIYPDRLISRPVDFLSALILLVALYGFLRLYHRKRAMLIWWISLSISVHMVGQVLMSFSKALYDPFFDIAHVYKVFGYLIPLFGFSLYQIAVILERKKAEEKLSEYSDGLEALVEERTAETRKINEQLQDEITERKQAAEALRKQTHALGERVKELNCLYGFSKLVEQPNISLEEIFQGIADLIPPSWQYPDITCAKTVFENKEFKTDNFKDTKWKQSADITVSGKKAGIIEVCYLEEKPVLDEDPFLKDERKLLNAIAERLGHIIERKKAVEALQESENRFRTIIDSSLDAIISIDQEGLVAIFNPTAEKIFGRKKEEMIGQPLDLLMPEEYRERHRQYVKGYFTRGKPRGAIGKTVELPALRSDGNVFPIDLSLSVGKTSGQEFVLAIIRDITERKQAE